MSHLPSLAGRSGATILVCVLVTAAAGGCAANKSSGPTPKATAITRYAKSAALARNLAALGEFAGPITGTMTVGSVARPLSGTVSLKGTSSQIDLVEGGATTDVIDEIVVGGKRYTSHDDETWVSRGTKAAGTTLQSALAHADTTSDAGVQKVAGIAAHRIVTAPDKVDVAPALGIDTWTFDDESTTLRIWADDAGKLVGFGASMNWRVSLGGVVEPVTADLDVVLTPSSRVEIAAPASPWTWHEDKALGIAVGLPAGWKASSINAAIGFTTYVDSSTGDSFAYDQAAAGKKSLEAVTKGVVDGLADTPSGTQTIAVAAEDASWLTVNRTKQKDYMVVVVVVHETLEYQIGVSGSQLDPNAVNAIAQRIVATIEFTR